GAGGGRKKAGFAEMVQQNAVHVRQHDGVIGPRDLLIQHGDFESGGTHHCGETLLASQQFLMVDNVYFAGQDGVELMLTGAAYPGVGNMAGHTRADGGRLNDLVDPGVMALQAYHFASSLRMDYVEFSMVA